MHACVICIDANARVHFNAAKQVMEANIGFQEVSVMAFSFELKLAISSELYGAISAGPEQWLPGAMPRAAS